MQNHHNAI